MSHIPTISFPSQPALPASRPPATRPTAPLIVHDTSFRQFIRRDGIGRFYWKLALAAAVIQLAIFKSLYPFPDFFGDSYSYIYAATAHLDVSIWPIGYSKFLAAFHGLTHSSTALVTFQYLFLELSALYFFLTVLYLLHPGRTARVILFCFLFFNPLFLYLSNYVNSDPLFAALSLLWFTEMLWIMNQPRLFRLLTQAVLLFLAFTVRNNAYIYPFLAVVAFALSRQKPWIKIIGMGLGPLLILPFVLHTRAVAKQMTGTAQFSLFTGWQLANNALYAYDHIPIDSNSLPTPATRELDHLSKEYLRKIPPNFGYRSFLDSYVGNFFIRQPQSPLKVYMGTHNIITDEYSNTVAWGRSSEVFNQYGSYLLKHYPMAVAKYFILPNTQNYFVPPLEKLAIYNLGQNGVPINVQDWFDLKTPDITVVSKTLQQKVLMIFPILFCMLNIYLAGRLAALLWKRKILKEKTVFRNEIILMTFFLAFNFCFSVLATVDVFRYQFFPMIICLSCLLLVMETGNKSRELQSA